jgi:hypothetical protein
MMTRQTNSEDRWRTLFHEQHTRLAAAAGALSYRNVPTGKILESALTEVEGYSFHKDFGPALALRLVVKTAIAVNYEATESEIQMTGPDLAENKHWGELRIGSLPWPERAVYFLRKALCYSRRDTALLLGLSDANVDQLYDLAEKRTSSSSLPLNAPSVISATASGGTLRSNYPAFAADE